MAEPAPLPPEELMRLAALRRYAVLDTPPEAAFDRIARLAASTLDTPIALVSLVDAGRQWFKARVGLDLREVPRHQALCAHAILDDRVFEVPDAQADPRFADNPLVVGEPGIRFHAGAPIRTAEGFRLGTVSVIDHRPRRLTEAQRDALTDLAAMALDALELKLALRISEQSKHAAERAERTKSEFLAAMSHEIRTPLNGILGMASVLLRADKDPGLSEKVRLIHDSGWSLLDTINNILDFSKLESGHAKLSEEPIDPAVVLSEAITMLRPIAEEKLLALDVTIAADLPRAVHADPVKLRQVIVNLIGNAIKFTDHGTVSVTLAHRPLDADHAELRIEVTDTGVGIDPSRQAGLFGAFVQADGSATRRFGGSGLGLAISRQLVDLMRGTIGFDSTLGEGSRFWFTLPVVCEAPARQPEPVPAAAKPAGLRVLLVEDNPMNRRVVGVMLEGSGHTLDEACDGLAAVEAAGNTRYDVILMDISMPGIDGVEATRRIRALGGHNATVPIAALTAHALPGHREELLAAGLDEYLAKPFTVTQLHTLLWAVAEALPAERVA